jgi:hypothetical protein
MQQDCMILEEIEILYRRGEFSAAFSASKMALLAEYDHPSKQTIFSWLQKSLSKHASVSERKESLANESEYTSLWTMATQSYGHYLEIPEAILLNQ